MNCDELRDHYELFALGLAEEPEKGEIRAHLARDCETCLPGVRRAEELMALLGTNGSACGTARAPAAANSGGGGGAELTQLELDAGMGSPGSRSAHRRGVLPVS